LLFYGGLFPGQGTGIVPDLRGKHSTNSGNSKPSARQEETAKTIPGKIPLTHFPIFGSILSMSAQFAIIAHGVCEGAVQEVISGSPYLLFLCKN
jgi:hypothetical protein